MTKTESFGQDGGTGGHAADNAGAPVASSASRIMILAIDVAFDREDRTDAFPRVLKFLESRLESN